jgi:propanol-preferring alcohol dehydrogenase
MKAQQLVEYGKPLETREIPIPEVRGEEVLVRIEGSGLCHSDIHIMKGIRRIVPTLPFTLGHENSGSVERVGENVIGFKRGDPVLVYGGWSKKPDRFAWTGQEQLTNISDWVGIGQQGGYAEYLKVPSFRYLLHADEIEITSAAVLTDAALTPYRAVKKLLPSLYPGSSAVIIGCGGLGQFGIQYVRLLAPGTKLVAIDKDEKKLSVAKNLGADVTINAKQSENEVVGKIMELTDNEGSQGIIDFVGSDSTLNQAYSMGGRQSKLVVVGLEEGTLRFKTGIMKEMEVTSSNWGSMSELAEVLALARAGRIRITTTRIGFDEMNTTFEALAGGGIEGRAVLLPRVA